MQELLDQMDAQYRSGLTDESSDTAHELPYSIRSNGWFPYDTRSRSRSGSTSLDYSGSSVGSYEDSVKSDACVETTSVNGYKEKDIPVEGQGSYASEAKNRNVDLEVEGPGENGMHDSPAATSIYDFDLMLTRRMEEQNKWRTRKRFHSRDNFEHVSVILNEMKNAAKADRTLNRLGKPAKNKVNLLRPMQSNIMKHDLQRIFLDHGVLRILTEWLTLMPDGSLPALKIRESVLKVLTQLPHLDKSLLKESGIGRVVMYLSKHPTETKANKALAESLINQWSRQVFNLSTDLRDLSKEEREILDSERMPIRRRRQSVDDKASGPEALADFSNALWTTERGSIRPGEPGWIPRARAPSPSSKDFIVRPQWNTYTEISDRKENPVPRITKYIRNLAAQKKAAKVEHAVKISLDGKNMSW